MAEQLDWSGFTDEETNTPANADAPEKIGTSLDWSGFNEETVQRKPVLSPEEVLQIAENEPERFRAAMERVRLKENKSVSERLNEYQGPLLRGMARGGQGVGTFAVNSVMRGLSYIPGMEHLSSKADHMNRLAAIQSAYDSYQDENSLTSEFIGANGAKLAGTLGETIAQGLLLGTAGRAAGAKSTSKMTAFMAASYGAMDTDRHLTIGKDAGLQGAQNTIYATGMGALSAGLTFAFGKAGEKLGGHTMEELMATGAGRSIASLMTREGLKRTAMDTAMEGTEEGSIAVAQAAYASMFGVEEDVDYASRFAQAFAGGAVARGLMGVGRALPDMFMEVLKKVPSTYKGFSLAQQQADGKITPAEAAEVAKTAEEAGDPEVKIAYEDEIAAIRKLQSEADSRLDPFVTRRAEIEKSKSDLETLRKEIETGQTQSEAHPMRVGDPKALVAGLRENVEKLTADHEAAVAAANNKKSRVDKREEYAMIAEDISEELEAAKSKLTSWESEETTPTGRSQYTEFYSRFPEGRYGEKVTIATMREQFPELNREEFNNLVLTMAREGRLSLFPAASGASDARMSESGIPSSTGKLRHVMMVKDPSKLPNTPDIVGAGSPDVDAKRKSLADAEADIKLKEDALGVEEQAAQADVQKTKEFLNAEMERLVARQEKIEQAQALEDATAAKNEFTDRDRVKFGLDELPPTEARAHLDALQSARAKGIPQQALEISKQAVGSNDLWDDETTIGVTAGYDLLKQQWADNRNRLSTATSPAEIESLMAIDKQLVNEAGIITEAIHRVGTGVGRALAIRKFIINTDGDPDIVLKRARKSKGEQLNPEEIRGIMESSAVVKKLNEERNALTPGTPEFDAKSFELYEARLKLETFENTPGKPTLKDRASMVNFLWRDIVTGVDMSAAGIQGALSLLSRPHVAVPSMWNGFKSHINERGAVRADYDLFTRKNGDLYKDGLITINPEGPLLRNEDLNMQTMYGPWSKIPGVQPFINFWPRIYRGMVNQLRADMFDSMIASAGGRGNLTRPVLEDLGGLVDIMTGRGGRGYLDKHVSTLNLAMFAPRFSFSQAEFLIGKPIWGASKESRKHVMKEYGRILASWVSLYSAAAIGNMFSNGAGEGDIMETVWDPKDSNFMKIKIGNTWVDPTFRLGRWVSAAGQTTSAIYNNLSGTQGTPVVGLDGKPIVTGKPPAGLDSRRAGSFVRGKLSLPLGTVVDLTTGTYMTGEKVSETGLPGLLKNRVAPIAPKEIAEAMQEYGVSEQLAVAMLGFIGAPLRPVIAPKTQFKPLNI